MVEVGVVHGRFQLLHNDHIKYILTGKEKCKHLFVGICNPDPRLSKYSEVDPHRTDDRANPFTYYERMQMIKLGLFESGLTQEEFDIVPFPISYPESIFYYTPRDAEYYLTIYDAWGLNKKNELERLGCRVNVLWQKSIEEKGVSATEIRARICNGEDWRPFVPVSVYNYIIENGLDKRMQTR